ncbi:DEAD/DEAH box helicase [Patescibacteria group bacterium]|nr:DEAD/DEAH box helicase [Patescibacteria group bacterium]
MPIDPIKLTQEIKESYTRYLTSAFCLRNEKLRELFYQETEKFWFTNGPILEATPPFKSGCYLKDLIDENLLKNKVYKLTSPNYVEKNSQKEQKNPMYILQDNPLYLHQEKALRKILNGRNVVISSGTGSGKTECFLFPIYNHLLKEHEEGKLTFGVHALLLYPMNALANDQLRRLREIARTMEKETPDIQITFGRYVGDTPETKKQGEEKFRLTNPDVEPVKSELLSREEMRENPPHILITNYAMLEYLLLRPKDSSFFDGEHAKHWKFLVLDEAHVYNGANGIEMGMLIRRLKDRVCDGKKGVLQCIATSATLVKEEKDFGKVAEFATNLFGERFEWDAEDGNRQDIIKGEKEKIKTQILESGTFTHSVRLYSILDNAIRENPVGRSFLEQCYEICNKNGVPQNILTGAKEQSNDDAKKFLYELLSRDEKIVKLRDLLEEGPSKFEDCAKQLFEVDNPSDTHRQALISLVNIAVWARPDKESLPLLPAHYHLFVRAPEGIFVSFYPEPRIFLERRERTKEGYAVFDLASCRRCGQEYLVGDIVDGRLKHSFSQMDTRRKNRYFLLWKEKNQLEEDEDEEVAVPEEIAKKGKIWKLCTKCGAVWEENEVPTCNCGHESGTIRTLIEIIPKNGILNKCYLCGLRSINIVREFIFQQDAPAAVLATVLFQNLKKKKQKERKILAFSDSRQDAAFFAPYLGYTYKRILFRRLIIETLQQNQSVKDYRLQTLCNDVLKLAEEKYLFDPGMDEKEKKKEIWGWILQEFCALDRRICLEGVGLLSFLTIPPNEWKPIDDLSKSPWNLSENESIALYQVLINTLRFNKAITFPNDGPSPQDEIFARFHRNREYRFRGEKSNAKKGIYSFIATSGHLNTRLEFLQKLYKQITGKEADKEECRKLLGKIWDDLKTNWIDKGLYQFSDPSKGVLFQLNYKYWRIAQEGQDTSSFICDKCGLISPVNIKGVCPTFGCNGKLESLNSSSRREEIMKNHYRYLYTNLSPVNMTVHEHTAQLKQDYASNIQQKFIKGEINVLSCSTTFELGVDLGELEIIFLRNVPPEPSNYIQRSGRAGRRLDSVGFTLTFAQLRSHDLTYFREPEKMVGGKIKPPVVEIRNEKIVRRHLHSVVLAKFFRDYRSYFGNANSFFHLDGEEVSGSEKLQEYLENKPVVILESLKRTIPGNLHDTFDLENWGWVKGLLGDKEGALETADAQIRDEYLRLKEFYQKKGDELKQIVDSGGNRIKENQLNRDRNWAIDRMNTIKRRQLIDFLATHTVIPKYGFPVDVVELTPLSHIPAAKNIRLERDLRIAISEFAPGSQVVANGYVWESAGLKVVRDRTWPVHWYAICPNCERFNIQEGTIEDNPPTILCKGCQKVIARSEMHKLITPIFGFVTSRELEPPKPGESRPKREFITRPYFFDYQEPKEEEFNIGKLKIKCRYSSHGELAVICKGRKGVGFWACFKCGVAFSKRPKGNAHKSPIGEECSSPLRGPLHFGHTFKTDVLTISLEEYIFDNGRIDQSFWYSLLYAILEGASQALGIRRQDLNGCLYPYEGRIALVLFDNVPGGAGHVKRIMDEQNIYEVLKSALDRVKNCTCGPETSCYGCLRNYQNQFCHEQLKRGIILEFLSNNLEDEEKTSER